MAMTKEYFLKELDNQNFTLFGMYLAMLLYLDGANDLSVSTFQ